MTDSKLDKPYLLASAVNTNDEQWRYHLQLAIDAYVKEEQEEVLTHLYCLDASLQVPIANYCDEVVDRSGAMLGRIRDAASRATKRQP